MTIRHTNRIIGLEMWRTIGIWKKEAKLELEYPNETLILRRNLFSKCFIDLDLWNRILLEYLLHNYCFLFYDGQNSILLHTAIFYVFLLLRSPNPLQWVDPFQCQIQSFHRLIQIWWRIGHWSLQYFKNIISLKVVNARAAEIVSSKLLKTIQHFKIEK